jgi:aryl-alcohol dehydrogenase-like predicted oxidoreductase
VLSRDRSIVPVIGARTRPQLTESLGALAVALTPADLAAIDAALPPAAVVGDRYSAPQMRMLDSER